MQILCFGDSNTYGYDPRGFFGDRYEAQDRWVDLLANMTQHQMFNGGMNGREIPRMSNSLEVFKASSAELFLIMLGTNDLLQGATAKETAARMEAFLIRLLPLKKHILLVAPPPMKRGAWVPADDLVSESAGLADEYMLVAKNLDIPFVDTRDWNVELTYDGVHFTEAGHHAFANRLAEYL